MWDIFKKRVQKFEKDRLFKRNARKQSDGTLDDTVLFLSIFMSFYTTSQIMKIIRYIFELDTMSIVNLLGGLLLYVISFFVASYVYLFYKSIRDYMDTEENY